jgi:soluble lytic murein transglycosylase
LKAGLLGFGALIAATPVFAQSQDPLAPFPSSEPASAQPIVAQPPVGDPDSPKRQSFTIPQQPSQRPAAPPATQPPLQPAPPPAPVVAIPKDWRGVFDAIDAGNWASARAGIAALPRSVLTTVARAELYTAKGSPAVDLASLQALLIEAPELPQADQLARMAITRGATTPPLIYPEKPVYRLGSAPVRYRAKPVQGEPAAD